MNTHKTSFIVAAAFLGVIALTSYILGTRDVHQAYGSVVISNEYNSTTTDAGWSTGCQAPLASTTKVLGSVVVTKTSNAPLYIYDATTTGPHSDYATTSIALFPSTAAGTYTFDVQAKRGICVVVDSTVGVASTTITTR